MDLVCTQRKIIYASNASEKMHYCFLEFNSTKDKILCYIIYCIAPGFVPSKSKDLFKNSKCRSLSAIFLKLLTLYHLLGLIFDREKTEHKQKQKYKSGRLTKKYTLRTTFLPSLQSLSEILKNEDLQHIAIH